MMNSYAIYKVIRPSRKSGKRLRIYVEWTCDKARALLHAREMYRHTCKDVEAVEVADCGASPSKVIYRLDSTHQLAS